jgi:hypothetical protein
MAGRMTVMGKLHGKKYEAYRASVIFKFLWPMGEDALIP